MNRRHFLKTITSLLIGIIPTFEIALPYYLRTIRFNRNKKVPLFAERTLGYQRMARALWEKSMQPCILKKFIGPDNVIQVKK